MSRERGSVVPVVDFRRQRMVLNWHTLAGTWSPFEAPPPLVHGIALIRGLPPNVCLYAQSGRLRLQIGTQQFAMSENSPRLRCVPDWLSFGLRRRFMVESSTGGVLFSQHYWAGQGPDFFRWLAGKSEDPDWRASAGLRWSDGVPADSLRGAEALRGA